MYFSMIDLKKKTKKKHWTKNVELNVFTQPRPFSFSPAGGVPEPSMRASSGCHVTARGALRCAPARRREAEEAEWSLDALVEQSEADVFHSVSAQLLSASFSKELLGCFTQGWSFRIPGFALRCWASSQVSSQTTTRKPSTLMNFFSVKTTEPRKQGSPTEWSVVSLWRLTAFVELWPSAWFFWRVLYQSKLIVDVNYSTYKMYTS